MVVLVDVAAAGRRDAAVDDATDERKAAATPERSTMTSRKKNRDALTLAFVLEKGDESMLLQEVAVV